MRRYFAASQAGGTRSVEARQQSWQIAQVSQLDIRDGMAFAQRLIEAIDPNGPDARIAGAGDITAKTVADHHGFMRRDPEPFERQLKNPGVRFPETDIARDDDRVEEAAEV